MSATTIEDLIDHRNWFIDRIVTLTNQVEAEQTSSYARMRELAEEIGDCQLGIQVVDLHINRKLMEN